MTVPPPFPKGKLESFVRACQKRTHGTCLAFQRVQILIEDIWFVSKRSK